MNKCAAWECPNRTQLGYCQLSACNRMDLWQEHNPQPTTSSATRLGRYGATTTNQTEVRQDGMDHGAKMAEMLRKEELQAENARLRAELQSVIESTQRIDNENLRLIKERDKAVGDIEKMMGQDVGDDKCWACAPGFSCGEERRCVPKWRGTEGKA